MSEKKSSDLNKAGLGGFQLRHVELGQMLDVYGSLLTEKQRNVLDLTVNADLSLAELAEEEGVSRQAIHEAIRRAENSLRRFEQQIGFLSFQQQVRTSLKEIESTLISSAEYSEKEKRCLALIEKLEEGLDS